MIDCSPPLRFYLKQIKLWTRASKIEFNRWADAALTVHDAPRPVVYLIQIKIYTESNSTVASEFEENLLTGFASVVVKFI